MLATSVSVFFLAERATPETHSRHSKVTKLFSASRQKSFEKLEGWFLPMLVGHASASGTGKMKDGPHSSFVSFSSQNAL